MSVLVGLDPVVNVSSAVDVALDDGCMVCTTRTVSGGSNTQIKTSITSGRTTAGLSTGRERLVGRRRLKCPRLSSPASSLEVSPESLGDRDLKRGEESIMSRARPRPHGRPCEDDGEEIKMSGKEYKKRRVVQALSTEVWETGLIIGDIGHTCVLLHRPCPDRANEATAD